MYEPAEALLAGEDGLGFYRRIALGAPEHINGEGSLVLEIGCGEAESVTEMLGLAGFAGIECHKDYSGRDRIVCCRKI